MREVFFFPGLRAAGLTARLAAFAFFAAGLRGFDFVEDLLSFDFVGGFFRFGIARTLSEFRRGA